MNQILAIPEESQRSQAVMLQVSKIVRNPEQPRTFFDEADIKELGKSILAYGQKEPIVVRPKGDMFELVSGERRYRAFMMMEIPIIETRVMKISDTDLHFESLLFNAGRRKLTPRDTFKAIVKEVDNGRKIADIATGLGKSVGWVRGYLSLKNLPPELQDMLEHGSKVNCLLLTEALELAKLPCHKQMLDRHNNTKALAPSLRQKLIKKAVQQTRSTHTKRPRAIPHVERAKVVITTVQTFDIFLRGLHGDPTRLQTTIEKMDSLDREKLEGTVDECMERLKTLSKLLNKLNK